MSFGVREHRSSATPRQPTDEEEEELVMSALRRLLIAIDVGDYATYAEVRRGCVRRAAAREHPS